MTAAARPKFTPHEMAIAIDDVYSRCFLRDGRLADGTLTIDREQVPKLKAAADLIDRIHPFQAEFKTWLARMESGGRR